MTVRVSLVSGLLIASAIMLTEPLKMATITFRIASRTVMESEKTAVVDLLTMPTILHNENQNLVLPYIPVSDQ